MELSTLTPEQEKAFRALARAHKKCQKLNIKFYTVLETIHALNGNEIKKVLTDDDIDADAKHSVGDYVDLSHFIFDHGFSGFSDDEHFIDDDSQQLISAKSDD